MESEEKGRDCERDVDHSATDDYMDEIIKKKGAVNMQAILHDAEMEDRFAE